MFIEKTCLILKPQCLNASAIDQVGISKAEKYLALPTFVAVVTAHLRSMRSDPTNMKNTNTKGLLRQTQTLHTFNHNSKLLL